MKQHPPVSPAIDGSALLVAHLRKKERRLFAWTCGWAITALLALGGIYAIEGSARIDSSKPPDPLSPNYPYDRIYSSYGFAIDKAIVLALLVLFSLIMMICLVRWVELKRRNRRAFPADFSANPLSRIS